MNSPTYEPADLEATDEQLAELKRLGVAEADLAGLSYSDAEEWLDELRARQLDAGKYGPPPVNRKP